MPGKEALIGERIVHLLRGTHDDELHGFRSRHRRGHSQQKVNVVFYAADAQRVDAVFARDAAEGKAKAAREIVALSMTGGLWC